VPIPELAPDRSIPAPLYRRFAARFFAAGFFAVFFTAFFFAAALAMSIPSLSGFMFESVRTS
jgi:hypothetical protein